MVFASIRVPDLTFKTCTLVPCHKLFITPIVKLTQVIFIDSTLYKENTRAKLVFYISRGYVFYISRGYVFYISRGYVFYISRGYDMDRFGPHLCIKCVLNLSFIILCTQLVYRLLTQAWSGGVLNIFIGVIDKRFHINVYSPQ